MNDIPDKSIDMVLCDLPYGTTACGWDEVIPFNPLWQHYERIIKDSGAIILFGSQPFTSKLVLSNIELFRYELIWHKNFSGGFANARRMPMKYHENVLVFYKNQPTYNPQFEEYADSVKKRFKEGESVNETTDLTNRIHGGFGGDSHKISFKRGKYPQSVQFFKGVTNANGIRLHPTQKPVELFEYLIKTYTNAGDVVLDNCIGSGTTAIACINTKRNFIGIELDEKYYNIAIDRVSKTPRRL